VSTSILVLVPTLDSYKLLPALVNSLQEQTFQQWRLIFIDGPSTSSHRIWLHNCCSTDTRLQWIPQDPSLPGIFGAMTQGLRYAKPTEWVLFWGSDDRASSHSVFEELNGHIDHGSGVADLIICSGQYFDSTNKRPQRKSVFCKPRVLNRSSFRKQLFLGNSPPHQAALFGPGAQKLLPSYSTSYYLAADLDYFLRLSTFPGLRVKCIALNLVQLGSGGVSSQMTFRRLREVISIYISSFGAFSFIPFLARYYRRLCSLLSVKL